MRFGSDLAFTIFAFAGPFARNLSTAKYFGGRFRKVYCASLQILPKQNLFFIFNYKGLLGFSGTTQTGPIGQGRGVGAPN